MASTDLVYDCLNYADGGPGLVWSYFDSLGGEKYACNVLVFI